ncbi:MAG: hypothetical protein AB7V42_13385 [Thermoleophilia bacterium]
MLLLRRLLGIAAVILLLGGMALPAVMADDTGSTPADDATLRIYRDFADNERLDDQYRPSELWAAMDALARAGDDAGYARFQSAVDEAFNESLLGQSAQNAAPPSRADLAGDLPEPVGADPGNEPPWPFIALSVLAALLVVTGAGSSIYRRARRDATGA